MGSEPKWTPWPWEMRYEFSPGPSIWSCETNEKIAELIPGPQYETIANGNLIAAAPALYEVLHKIAWKRIGRYDWTSDKMLEEIESIAKDVLALAEGRVPDAP